MIKPFFGPEFLINLGYYQEVMPKGTFYNKSCLWDTGNGVRMNYDDIYGPQNLQIKPDNGLNWKGTVLWVLFILFTGYAVGKMLFHFPSFRNGWQPNIRVLASSNEEELSYFGFYTAALVDHLKAPGVNSWEEAQKALEKEGMLIGQNKHYPVSMPGNLNSWDKTDTVKPRYALLLGGPAYAGMLDTSGHMTEDTAMNYSSGELSMMTTALKDPMLYDLPPEHLHAVDPASSGDVASGLQWLHGKLAAEPGAEGLVFINSHGNQQSSAIKMPWDAEGDSEGYLLFRDGLMHEKTLKTWINSTLGQTTLAGNHPVLVIVLACHAGAFIAQNRPLSDHPLTDTRINRMRFGLQYVSGS